MKPTSANRERAQSILEFAIVLPLFLILLFAVIDFSRLLFTYVSMSNGTREFARSVAISNNWSSTAPVTAFNNYTVVAGPENSSTDNVTVLIGSATCAHTEDTGGTCTGSQAPTSVTCTLPLQSSCLSSTTAPTQGGFVEVQLTYTFHFNPLFQTRLDGVVDVSFMKPTAMVTTTARAYVE